MLQRWFLTLSLACAFLLPAVEAQSVSISGDVSSPFTLTVESLAAMPHQTVTLDDPHSGKKVSYEGVPLLQILQRAGAPLGKDLKGKTMASYVLIKAKDDYQVVFALTELDPEFRDTTAIVADKREGQPLTGTEGPLRLVVTSDKKPARSVRMLTAIEVVSLRK